MLKIRRPLGRLIFNMGIAISGKTVFLIETAPCCCYVAINTLRPRQNGRHFADDTFKRIFMNQNVNISFKISLKVVPRGPINNIPALVQIMAWRRQGDKQLSEPMMIRLLTHICVTRPQWVKSTVSMIACFLSLCGYILLLIYIISALFSYLDIFLNTIFSLCYFIYHIIYFWLLFFPSFLSISLINLIYHCHYRWYFIPFYTSADALCTPGLTREIFIEY